MRGSRSQPPFFAPLALIAALLVGGAARAQVVPPPPVPQHPDVPLPDWHPPRIKPQALHLRVSPAAARAHTIRQAGLWFASIGGAALFAGGILFSNASDINETLSHSHNVVATDGHGGYLSYSSTVFDPALEDARDIRLAASQGLLISGGVCFATGAVLFTLGQLQLRQLHREHPKDPLPALSGY